ncbi:MAG: hypothetical protein KDK70_07425 [Myxococcales bacterium]|nr:hypothetical protein [Myxococcales bacterium]
MACTEIGKTWSWGMLCALLVACGGDDGREDSTSVATVAPTTTPTTTTMGDSDGSGSSSTASATDDADTTVGASESSDDGGPPPLPTCHHQCTTAPDCMIDGNSIGFDCLGGLCGVACVDDTFCIAASSGWLALPCNGDGDCNGGACVDVGDGTGGCSFTPAQGDCADANLQQTQWPALGGGMIDVCARTNARCGDFDGTAACFLGCLPGDCGDMTCGDDGYCICEFDTQCVDAGMGNNCNAQSRCELACQQASDCPASGFDGGTVVCE